MLKFFKSISLINSKANNSIILKNYINSNFIKIFIGSGLSTSVKIITTIIISKVIAEQLGPNGLGLIGQLSSFLSITLLIGTGGFSNGIISFTSIYSKSEKLADFIKSSFKFTLLISLFTSILLFCLASLLSNLIFHSSRFHYPFYFIGFSLFLYSINTYFYSFLNGIGNFKIYNTLNIINSLFSLFVTIILVKWMDLKGALLAVIFSQTLTSVATFYFISKYKTIFWGFYKAPINAVIIQKLLPYAKMTFLSAILLPVSQIIVRNMILASKGNIEMGMLEAINRTSNIYLMIILNIMLLYYLPRISISNNKKEVLNEIKKGALLFESILIIIGLLLFFFRFAIIKMAFSSSFYEVSSLIIPQLISDLFKVLYFLFAYFAISKSLSKYYIITELLFYSLYVSLAYFLIPVYSVKGAIYSNIFMNIFACLIHFYFIAYLYFKKRNKLTKFLFGSLNQELVNNSSLVKEIE